MLKYYYCSTRSCTGMSMSLNSTEVTRLQARLIDQYTKHEKQNLILKLEKADEETTRQLLVRVTELDTLLSKAQQS
jgi:hypothetical protein